MGELRRHEASELIVGYSFNLQTNDLIPNTIANPGAGREHAFRAWRLKGSPADRVSLRPLPLRLEVPDTDDDTTDELTSRLIETDAFPFEFLSQLAERESWRKEVHRPIYHVHKWWAKRLGSVFRGILLGTSLPEEDDLPQGVLSRIITFETLPYLIPFMGSGTTIGEAHKLGMTALGRDINPVAVEAVCTALGPMERIHLQHAFHALSQGVGQSIRALYRSKDARGRACDVLYYFWVMQVHCLECHEHVDLFPSWIIARNAYPKRKPEVQILCPSCGDIFPGLQVKRPQRAHRAVRSSIPSTDRQTEPRPRASIATTSSPSWMPWPRAVTRPAFRLYGKLVLTPDGAKEYLPATPEDQAAYQDCSATLRAGNRTRPYPAAHACSRTWLQHAPGDEL